MGIETVAAVTALAGLALTAYSTHQAAQGQRDAAKQQQEAARRATALANQNAKLIETENARAEMLLGEQHAEDSARRRAIAAASGIEGLTQDTFLATQATKEEEDLDFLRKTGESRADLERQRGRDAALTGFASAEAQAARARGTLLTGTQQGLTQVGTLSTAGKTAGWWT